MAKEEDFIYKIPDYTALEINTLLNKVTSLLNFVEIPADLSDISFDRITPGITGRISNTDALRIVYDKANNLVNFESRTVGATTGFRLRSDGKITCAYLEFLGSIGIKDSFGTLWLGMGVNSSAVNYLLISNDITNESPALQARGNDTNVSIGLVPKGTGGIIVSSTAGDVPDDSAKLQIDSTTQGFLPPRLTTTQRDAISSPIAGLIIYNTTTSKLNVYTTAWEAITSV